jgi:hypothetical protein
MELPKYSINVLRHTSLLGYICITANEAEKKAKIDVRGTKAVCWLAKVHYFSRRDYL